MKLELAGQRALAEAERLWSLDIIDPAPGDRSLAAARGYAAIDDIMTASGWGWATPYPGNHKGPEWCGLTAGACWRAAGIDPKWLATYFASTFRLWAWAHYQPFDSKHPNPKQAAPRLAAKIDGSLPAGVVPRAGDVLVVGDGTPSTGDHITIVSSFNGRTFSTISGNGGGIGPDGKRREGMVKRDFGLSGPGYRAMWLYRPSESDLL